MKQVMSTIDKVSAHSGDDHPVFTYQKQNDKFLFAPLIWFIRMDLRQLTAGSKAKQVAS